MNTEVPDIRFEAVTDAHLPMLHRWLKEQHVRQWWGDPDEELELIRSIADDDYGAAGFVICLDRAPIGYIQSWRPANFDGTHWVEKAPWLGEVPRDTIGIDVFIGPASLIEKGVGTKVIRAFAKKLFEEGAPRLIIDPDAANGRAVSAYGKAGFTPFARHDGDEESTLLMELYPDRPGQM